MEARSENAAVADLLAETDWLSRLAYRLVRDAHVADDLVQDTLLRALERPPETDRPLRPWLGTVLGNLVRGRARRQRTARTTDAGGDALATAASGAVDVSAELARFEEQRFLVEAVHELPDPYRAAVVRRFFSGVSSAELAREEGVAPATIRWRVHEGLERLRQRLDEREGGDRRAWCVALLPLARPSAGATAVATGTTTWLGGIAMYAFSKSGAAGLAAVLLVLLGARWWSTAGAPPVVESVDRAAVELVAPPALVVGASDEPDGEDVLIQTPAPEVRADAAVPELERATEGAAAATIEPVNVGDREWGRVTVRVVDEYGSPIPMTELEAGSLRAHEQFIDGHAWPSEPPTAVADANGEAEFAYPLVIAPNLTTAAFDLQLRHPEFLPQFTSCRVPDGSGSDPVFEVTLERGGLLIVSGWRDDAEDVVTDVTARLSNSAGHAGLAWSPLRDGRPATGDVPPGTHTLVLMHTDEEGRVWHSEPHEFELAEGESRDLHIELHPGIALHGRLAAEVPRPIQNGQVVLNLVAGVDEHARRINLLFFGEVQADGSFEVPGLPLAGGEIVAACEGWSSIHRPRAVSEDEIAGAELVLEVEPTAELVLNLIDPSGAPAENVEVMMSSQVFFSSGTAPGLSRWHSSTTSNEFGHAVLSNLTPGERKLYVRHPELQLPEREDERGRTYRNLELELDPGARVEREVEMELVE